MSSKNQQKKRKREICQHCQRPKLHTCICSALPDEPLSLSKSRLIVLQHPHERRRKNRSLPLVELCFRNRSSACKAIEQTENDERNHSLVEEEKGDSSIDKDFHCIVARRLGDHVNQNLMNLINDPNQFLFLVYPSDDAIELNEALRKVNREGNDMGTRNHDDGAIHNNSDKRVTLLFIDATWKYANEMLKAGLKNNIWPSHMIYVKLTKDDLTAGFKPRRFDIRTPPSIDQLSTAECIAHTLRVVEERDDIFDILMKPLDLMVQQWHSFSDNNRNNAKREKREKMINLKKG